MSVTLRNTGNRRGREVVQVYLSRSRSSLERPVRWLAGYASVDGDGGDETSVTIVLPARSFAYWDEAAAAWTVETGAYEVHVGRSAFDLRASTTVTLG